MQIFFASDGTGISFAADEAHGLLVCSDVPDDRGETAADVSMEDPPVGSGEVRRGSQFAGVSPFALECAGRSGC